MALSELTRSKCAKSAALHSVAPNDRFSIAADGSGAIFVAASVGSDESGAHVVLELDADGEPRGFVTGRGVLMEAPIHASARGISVPVTERRGTDVLGYEYGSFRRGHGMPERCF